MCSLLLLLDTATNLSLSYHHPPPPKKKGKKECILQISLSYTGMCMKGTRKEEMLINNNHS